MRKFGKHKMFDSEFATGGPAWYLEQFKNGESLSHTRYERTRKYRKSTHLDDMRFFIIAYFVKKIVYLIQV